MRAEAEVFNALMLDPGIVTLVADRIWPSIAPQDAPLPLIVYERRDTRPVITIHDGKPVVSFATVAVAIYAKTPLKAATIAEQTLAAMHEKGVPTNRYTEYNPTTGEHAAVVEFEVSEI